MLDNSQNLSSINFGDDDSFSTFKNLDDSVEMTIMNASTHINSSKKIIHLDDKVRAN